MLILFFFSYGAKTNDVVFNMVVADVIWGLLAMQISFLLRQS